MNLVFMPITATVVYAIMEVYKSFTKSGSKWRSFIPLLSIILGAAIGISFYLIFPDYVIAKALPVAAMAGAVSGLAASGSHEALKFFNKQTCPPAKE